MLSIARLTTIFLGFIVTTGLAAPLWTSEQTIRHVNDKVIVVTCRGDGMAKDLSFRQAISQCNSIAADEANGQFQSKTIIVETESQQVKLHSQSYSEKQVTGLTPKTEKEFTEQTNGTFVTHLQVRYDLSRAKVVSVNEQDNSAVQSEAQTSVVEKEIESKVPSTIKAKKIIQSGRSVLVTTIPKCKDAIIRGNHPRSQECTNPMQLVVLDGDTEIILRPIDPGFLPKTLKVNGRHPTNYEAESVTVQFERK